MKKDQAIALRAGLFVIIMLVATAITIFVLGTERGYFKKVFTVYASFSNVLGLQPGAPVRLSGVTVGKVDSVNVPQDMAKTKLEVVMQIERKFQSRVRANSIASIRSLSYVTGDYYVEISMGNSNSAMLKEGDFIQSTDPADFSRAFEDGINVVDSIYKNLKEIEETRLFERLSNSAKSLNDVIEEIKTGKGMLHALIYEPEGKNLIDNISKTSEHLRKVTQDVDRITNQIKSGNGLLHAILYDEEKRKILDNLAQATEDLKNVTEKIVEGEGSLGAIINDPDLYDNLNQLLGGANRSFILRTLIRRSIKKDISGEVK
ncbi:MAG: MCE family protein [Candidatus Scalindua sediminis]|nr:MCE family protein [Candidatus Scalindua sediminis]